MMQDVVTAALPLWGLERVEAEFVAARENTIYRVGEYALRLHRVGYRRDLELASELEWMAALVAGGLTVPAPLASRNKRFLEHVSGVQVDVLTWLPGEPVSQADARAETFFALGQEMARLHILSDDWTPPAAFQRVHWDRDGLLGDAPLWGRFWDNPELTAEEARQARAFRDYGAERLSGLSHDYGLIHADLVPGNVLVDKTALYFIDFDDGGFGFRLFDLATALHKVSDWPNYPALHNALLEGYLRNRALDLDELDLFLTIRAATYVGWNIARLAEPGGRERNRRFIDVMLRLIRRHLK